MLTPAFEIRQDGETVYLTIKAPYTNIKNCDIYVCEDEVKFFSEPYFLRLNLPGNVLENGNSTSKYDADTGTFHIVLPKEKPGEHFNDLEMLTKLLAPKLKPGQSLIEEIDEADDADLDDEDGDIWQAKQEPFEESIGPHGRYYGFNRSKNGVIKRMQEDLPNICDIRDPELKTVTQARDERLAEEQTKFDDLHFFEDFFDEEGVIDGFNRLEIDYTTPVEFTEEERQILATLSPKNYLMSKDDKLHCLLGLADIVYAFAYTNRINAAEWNSESGWTVAKVSATLSYFEEFPSMKAVVTSCLRRTLIFPLYRNYDLAFRCWQDATEIIRQGSTRVLKCLLQIYEVFRNDNDGRHVLNDLYIADYCVWLQRQCKANRLQEIAERMSRVEVVKDDLGLRIPELERVANSVQDVDVENLRRAEQSSSLDSDDSESSSTSAQDSDDYHSCDEPNSSDASSSESERSDSSSLASASSHNRTL